MKILRARCRRANISGKKGSMKTKGSRAGRDPVHGKPGQHRIDLNVPVGKFV